MLLVGAGVADEEVLAEMKEVCDQLRLLHLYLHYMKS